MSPKSDFATLFKDQHKRLVGLACRLGLTKEHADEIVQESFASLWKKICEGEAPDSSIAFLLTVVRNNTYNALKRRGFERKIFYEYLEQDLTTDEWSEEKSKLPMQKEVAEAMVRKYDDDDKEPQAPRKMEQDCVKKKVSEFRRQFPEAGYALKMHMDGIEVDKIAEAIQRTPGATSTYLVQVRRKLRPFLDECR